MNGLMCLPTSLTALRLLLVPVLWWTVLGGYLWTAFGVFAVACLSDVLDGFFARRFDCVSRFGAIFDPFVDKIFMLSMYALMFVAPTMLSIPWWFLILMGLKELLLSLGALYFGIVKKEIAVSAAIPGKIGGFVQGVFVLYWFVAVILGPRVFVVFGLGRGLWLLMWGMRLFYGLMVLSVVANLAAFLFYLFTFFSQRTLNK